MRNWEKMLAMVLRSGMTAIMKVKEVLSLDVEGVRQYMGTWIFFMLSPLGLSCFHFYLPLLFAVDMMALIRAIRSRREQAATLGTSTSTP